MLWNTTYEYTDISYFQLYVFVYLKFFMIKISKIRKDIRKGQERQTICILLSKQNDGYRATKQDGGLTSVMCLVTQESSPPLAKTKDWQINVDKHVNRQIIHHWHESKTVKVLWKIDKNLLLNVCVAIQFHSRLCTSKLVSMSTKIYVEIFIAVHS